MNTEKQKILLLKKLKEVCEEVKSKSNDEEFIKYADFKASTFDLEIKVYSSDTLEPQTKKTKYSDYLVDGNYFCKFCNKSISDLSNFKKHLETSSHKSLEKAFQDNLIDADKIAENGGNKTYFQVLIDGKEKTITLKQGHDEYMNQLKKQGQIKKDISEMLGKPLFQVKLLGEESIFKTVQVKDPAHKASLQQFEKRLRQIRLNMKNLFQYYKMHFVLNNENKDDSE